MNNVSSGVGRITLRSAADGAPRHRPTRRFYRILSKNIAYVAFLLLVIFFSLTAGDKFLTVRNWSLILEQVPILTILALGMTFVITAGFIDLSVGSALGMACLMGALGAQWLGLPGVLLGILVGAAIGLFNGALFNFLRIPSFIVTLAMMVISTCTVAIISGGFAVYHKRCHGSLSYGSDASRKSPW